MDKLGELALNNIYNYDCIEGLKLLPDECINTCVTSPPYFGLRDYGKNGQIGIEETLDQYMDNIVKVFREIKRVLRDDGTLWLNLGDTYNAGRNGGHAGGKKQWKPEQQKYQNRSGVNVKGLKPKELVGIPWRVALALQKDGWYLRSDIIWHKPNPMPESVRDRPTKAHEYIFLLTKTRKYYYDYEAIKEPTVDNDKLRNKRSVWSVKVKPFKEAHFAVFPQELIEPCIIAGCPKDGIVIDPFMGSGTTAVVSKSLNRSFIGFELNPEYIKIANKRLKDNKIKG